MDWPGEHARPDGGLLVVVRTAEPGLGAGYRRYDHQLLSALVLAGAVVWTVSLFLLLDSHVLDLQVYRTGGQAWINNQPPYDPLFPAQPPRPPLPFTFPPPAALPFAVAAVGHANAAENLRLTIISGNTHHYAPIGAAIGSIGPWVIGLGAMTAGDRLQLWHGLFGRFFPWVWASIIVLLLSGFGMMLFGLGGFAGSGLHVHIMTLTGLVMMALFLHLFFAPWRRFRRALDGGDLSTAASQLNHPNSISVFDFGRTEDGQPYLVMEFLRGKDLARVAYEEGPLSFRRIVDVLVQVLTALGEAHELELQLFPDLCVHQQVHHVRVKVAFLCHCLQNLDCTLKRDRRFVRPVACRQAVEHVGHGHEP